MVQVQQTPKCSLFSKRQTVQMGKDTMLLVLSNCGSKYIAIVHNQVEILLYLYTVMSSFHLGKYDFSSAARA